MLDSLPQRDKICGFISGKTELLNWESSELFQFYYDTKQIKGSIDCLLDVINRYSIKRAIKIGACNIYHGCVHNMLHEKSCDILNGLYKSASFTMQAIVFIRTGKYTRCQNDLLNYLSSDEGKIVNTFLSIKNRGEHDFDKMSEALFAWSKRYIYESSLV